MEITGNLWQGRLTRLRAFAPRDAELYASWAECPDAEADRLADRVYLPRSSEQRREALLRSALTPADEMASAYRFMIDDLSGGTVGTLTVDRADPFNGTFMAGFTIFAPYRRRGYASDALLTVLGHHFGQRRYVKCTDVVYAFNQASIALHEKLGFTLEGRVRRGVFSRGTHHDVLLYGITSDEFFARYPNEEVSP